jgi:hypothetical protein
LKTLCNAVVVTSLALASGVALPAPEARYFLVTDEQLAQLASAVEGGAVAPGIRRAVTSLRGTSDGPRVELLRPAAGTAVKPPAELEIRFEPRAAPIELRTLQVWYVLAKGEFEFEVDVTTQVRRHFTDSGVRLWIPEAAPKGTHRVRLALEDRQGKRTEERFSVDVH